MVAAALVALELVATVTVAAVTVKVELIVLKLSTSTDANISISSYRRFIAELFGLVFYVCVAHFNNKCNNNI